MIEARNQSVITLAGGQICYVDGIPSDPCTGNGSIAARGGASLIRIAGDDFEVDTGAGPQPVPYGVLQALSGRLSGTLAFGDPIDSVFLHGGAQDGLDTYDGTIELVGAPEPSGWVGLAVGVALIAGRARTRSRMS